MLGTWRRCIPTYYFDAHITGLAVFVRSCRFILKSQYKVDFVIEATGQVADARVSLGHDDGISDCETLTARVRSLFNCKSDRARFENMTRVITSHRWQRYLCFLQRGVQPAYLSCLMGRGLETAAYVC